MQVDEVLASIKAVEIERRELKQPRRLKWRLDGDLLRIFVILSGHLDVRIQGRTYVVQRGSCLLVRPGENGGLKRRGTTVPTYLCLHIPIDLLGFSSALEQDLRPCLFESAGHKVIMNNRQTNNFLVRCDAFIEHRLDTVTQSHGPLADLHHLLGILLLIDAAWQDDNQAKYQASHPLVKAALTYIDDDLSNPEISLRDCAEQIKCTSTYLSRVFREEIGRGFKDYVLLKRTARAKHLLRNGATVTEACFQSGFNDYANFVKRFKQRCGMSPGRFRRDHLPLQD